MSAIPAAARDAYAARQPHLMTGGRRDRSGCYVLLADWWRSEADMCPHRATHYVCVDDYRAGVTADGVFTPGETLTHVCAAHHDEVRAAPGFRWSHPTTRTDTIEEQS